MQNSIIEGYRKKKLSPTGKPINPKHFKDRWKRHDYRVKKEKLEEENLKILLENWNGEWRTCKVCGNSYPLTEEFWPKNVKHFRLECKKTPVTVGCHSLNGGGTGEKSQNSYKKTKMKTVLQNLMTSQIRSDKVKGWISDLDIEWMIEQEKKGDALAKELYGIDYLPFSYEDPGKGESNPMGPSLDRIDSTLPHTKDNCQLVWRITHLGPKNTTPEWRKKVYDFLKEKRKK